MKKTRSNIFRDIYYQPYNASSRLSLYTSSKASLQLIQRMSLLKRLKVHNGCVNSICWNSTGELILSGSDDQHLVLTNAYNYEVLTDYRTSHRANIFSAKFLPNSGDHRIVSCSGDGIILYTDLMRKSETFYNRFTCHSGTTYEIATIPGEPHSFLSCGEDGTVRWFDLRVKDSCNAPRCREDVLISCQKAVTALSVNPVLPHQIAIGCSDSTVRTFDRRTLGTPATGWTDTGGAVKPLSSFTVPELEGNSYRITSLSYSPDGQDVLVSYSSDHIYLFSMKDQCNVHFRKEVNVSKGKGKKHPLRSPQPVRRLRLRGDWSDTGPDARPGRGRGRRGGPEIAQARPVLQSLLMQRMADVVTRILNGPETRAVLSGGGESSFEDIMEQQANNQSSENNAEASEERSAESAEEAAAQPGDQGGEPIDVDGQHDTSDDAAGVDETQDAEGSSDQAQEQEFSQPTVQPSNESEAESETNVPMETESSQTEAQKSPTEESTLSCTTSERNEVQEEERIDEGPCTSMGTTRERDMMENLQDRLTTMRDGFLEKHGSEPAVSLTYSDKGSTSATISLGVADEIIRDGYHAGPSGSRGNVSSGSDHDKRLRCTEEKTDDGAFSDSDDEDVTPSARLINSVESEMDEAIANARSHQGHENFDETCLTELCVKQKYMGHRNARTMIKEANFWGNDFVMSGSDCGHVFVWERETAKLCMLLEADQHVVNCLQPHPYLPMLATSGIDYDVKLWAPINYESNFAEEFAEDLKKRNAVMLEETKDTITVPTDFMIRMLTCICQIRRERQNRRRAGDEI